MSEKPVIDIWQAICERKWRERRLITEIKSRMYIEGVGFYPTHKCNLNCKHCFWMTNKTKLPELDRDDWISIINQFINNGTKHFHICGKEPLLSKKTFDILQYLSRVKKNKYIKVGIITNGILVEKYTDLLKSFNIDYINFSIDGMATENDWLRGKGSFKKTINSLDMIIKSNNRNIKSISTSSVLYTENIDSIINLIFYLNRNWGITYFFFQPLRPHGKASELYDFVLMPEQLDDVLKKIIAKTKILENIHIKFEIPQIYMPFLYSNNEIVKKTYSAFISYSEPIIHLEKNRKISFRYHPICKAFWRRARVSADGFFLGCDMAMTSNDYTKYSIGNLKDQLLKSILNDAIDKKSILRDIISSYVNVKCKNCNNFNLCNSGCKIETYESYHTWIERNPFCWLRYHP